MEILPAPTGLFSTDLPSRRAHGNGTTCTTRSDFSGHECRLHSAAACGGSLPSPQESLVQSTSRRKDALPHTYPGSSSRLDHTFSWYSCLCHTSHNRCSLCSDALDNTVHPSGWDSRISTGLLWFSRHLSTFFLPQKKPLQIFSATACFHFCHLNYIILPYCTSIAFTANFQGSRFFSASRHGAGTLSSCSCSAL